MLPDWKKITFAVREDLSSRGNYGPIERFLEPLGAIVLGCLRGFRRGSQLCPMMPRDESLKQRYASSSVGVLFKAIFLYIFIKLVMILNISYCFGNLTIWKPINESVSLTVDE